MRRTPSIKSLAARSLVATALLALVAAIVGLHLAPTAPLRVVLICSALGAAAVLVLLVAVAIVSLTLSQFVLRKGGTDPQWFWFDDEPPGRVDLRERERTSPSSTTK